MPDAAWGNPSFKSFQKKKIRTVAVDEFRAKMHADILPIAEHVLKLLSESDLKVKQLTGYPASKLGTGFHIVIDGDESLHATFREAMAKYGFAAARTPDLYEWAGTHAEAVAAGEALDDEADKAQHATVQAEPIASGDDPSSWVFSDAPGWFDGRPGERDIHPESVGRDVLFLQAYLNTPRTGEYDDILAEAIRDYQAKKGEQPTGVVDHTTWRHLIPRIRPRLRPGDAGRGTRTISAAIIAAGLVERDSGVQDRFGVLMSRAVRTAQAGSGDRVNGRVGALEWDRLLAYPWTH